MRSSVERAALVECQLLAAPFVKGGQTMIGGKMSTWGTSDVIVSDLGEFFGAFNDVMPSTARVDSFYWFRGQSNSNWNLKPAFSRTLGQSGLPLEEVIGLEEQALHAFQSKAHFFVSPQLLAKVRTKPCWWALMQHHSAPTRLLDWTSSPFVAAYFACQQEAGGGDGAVWAFCYKKLRQKAVGFLGGEPPDFESESAPGWYADKLNELRTQRIVVPLEHRYASSERMVAQQGKFTMCLNPLDSHDCVIGQIGAENVRKVVIPQDRKSSFLLRLRDMNITGASLFPGVDGLGQSVKELISLGSYYRQVVNEEVCTTETSHSELKELVAANREPI